MEKKSQEIYDLVKDNICKKLFSYKNDLFNQISFWKIEDKNLVNELKEDIDNKFLLNENMLENLWNSKSIPNDLLVDMNSSNVLNIANQLIKINIITKEKERIYSELIEKGQIKDVKADIIDQISKNLITELSLRYFNYFDMLRRKYIEELLKKMKIIEELSKNLKSFSDIFGRFWDLSAHDLYKVNIDMLNKLQDILRKNNFIEKIAQLLGRLASSSKKYEEQLIKESIFVSNNKKVFYSPENTTSIKFGNEIQNILRYQFVLRLKQSTSNIFNVNYIEKKLLQLDQNAKLLDEIEVNRKERKFMEDEKGPFIMCIDTSGSMHGEPENIAKAFAMAIVKIASKEKRKCYIISFSTGTYEFDASNLSSNFDRFYEFLSMSFHGGTDIIPALESSIKKSKEKDYKNSDIIIISDFIINSISDNLKKDIDEIKKKKVRLHALSIGTSQIKENMDYFTNNWVYDGTQESIDKIIKDLNK